MTRGAWRAVACALLALSGCDSGPQVLGWEGASSGAAGSRCPGSAGPATTTNGRAVFRQIPSYFPIGVWMQNPTNAARYQAVGVNHYVGLWQGPTEEQLIAMVAAGMPVVCEQAGVWQAHLDDATIQGWLRGRRARQRARESRTAPYAPCIAPSVTQARYAADDGRRRRRAPSR